MSWPIDENVKLALGILGNIIALGLFLVPVKTVYTVIRCGGTEDYSVVPYVTTMLNCLLWTFYGLPIVGEGRTLVITVNAIGVALESIYICVFFLYNTRKQRVRTALFTGGALLLFGVTAATTVAAFSTSESRSMFLGIINDVVSIIMYSAPLEIMFLVVRTKSVKYMPLSLSVLVLSNSVAWAVYAIYVRDIFIVIPNGVGVLLGIAQIVIWVCYRRIEIVAESRRNLTSKSMNESESETESLETVESGRSIQHCSSDSSGV